MLSEIKFYINCIVSPISICLNILLLYLITYKSSYNLTNFKKVLFLGCITDLVYGIVNLLIECDVTVINGIYYTFTKGILGYLPFPLSMWSFPVNLFFIYFSLANVVVQFVYRYLLTCWKIVLTTFKFMCLVFISAVLVGAYSATFVYHILTRNHPDEFYTLNLYGTEWEVNGKIPAFGAFPVTAFPNAFFYAFGLVIFGYILLIFCGIKIWFGIRSYDPNNNPLHKYQTQISIVMTIEACIPILTLVFPIFLDLTTILTGIIVPWGGKVSLLLTCFAPILNPIVKLFVISSYRRWILTMFLKKNPQIVSLPSGGGIRTSTIHPSKPL